MNDNTLEIAALEEMINKLKALKESIKNNSSDKAKQAASTTAETTTAKQSVPDDLKNKVAQFIKTAKDIADRCNPNNATNETQYTSFISQLNAQNRQLEKIKGELTAGNYSDSGDLLKEINGLQTTITTYIGELNNKKNTTTSTTQQPTPQPTETPESTPQPAETSESTPPTLQPMTVKELIDKIQTMKANNSIQNYYYFKHNDNSGKLFKSTEQPSGMSYIMISSNLLVPCIDEPVKTELISNLLFDCDRGAHGVTEENWEITPCVINLNNSTQPVRQKGSIRDPLYKGLHDLFKNPDTKDSNTVNEQADPLFGYFK